MSGRSVAQPLARNSSTSRPVSAAVGARGARLPLLFSAVAERPGFTATAPSWIVSANFPESHARTVLAAPGPLLLAITAGARLTTPGGTTRMQS
jgi:hypothetical protein